VTAVPYQRPYSILNCLSPPVKSTTSWGLTPDLTGPYRRALASKCAPVQTGQGQKRSAPWRVWSGKNNSDQALQAQCAAKTIPDRNAWAFPVFAPLLWKSAAFLSCRYPKMRQEIGVPLCLRLSRPTQRSNCRLNPIARVGNYCLNLAEVIDAEKFYAW
jgi:hypothetical protein